MDIARPAGPLRRHRRRGRVPVAPPAPARTPLPAPRCAPSAMRLAVLLVALLVLPCRADEVALAVAANFRAPLEALAADFERQSGHRLVAAYGSTGKFYAQIRNGAPYAVLLAADAATPQRLEAEGAAVAGSRFTYAMGSLVLWSVQPGLVDPQGAILRTALAATARPAVDHLAMADPALAPYGAAARQTLQALGLRAAWEPRLVQGEDISQAYQFVATGNAQMGFVAQSQVYRDGALALGSAWIVPQDLYAPIRQDAVLLNAGRDHAAARAFLRFLQSDATRARLAAFGYRAP